MAEDDFATRVLAWFDRHGRKDLPWQHQPSPYRVWVSEIMLQQTQVSTVIPYYQRFLQQFPDVLTLAAAPLDTVLQHWEGLGYYSRARNLHQTACIVRDHYGGTFPLTLDEMQSLPGIGRSTAAAILSLSHDRPHAILDGNVKRVLARYHAVAGWPGEPQTLQRLWHYAEQHVPPSRNAAYTQAMMDLGATLCTRSNPACLSCPLQTGCKAFVQGNPQAYPGKRPAKALPEKTATALLLRNAEGDTLLKKRPPTGIWGGLWSFPEFASPQAMQDWLDQYAPHAVPVALARQMHTFSHYRLHLQLMAADLHASPAWVMEGDGWLWYKTGSALTGGLAAAVRRFFQHQPIPV